MLCISNRIVSPVTLRVYVCEQKPYPKEKKRREVKKEERKNGRINDNG